MIPLQSAVFADILQDVGVPYARPIGSAVTFVVAFVVLYFVGRAVIGRVVGRVLDRRGLDVHAKRPLQKLTRIVIVFAAIAVAFGLAGYGNFLGALATVAAAATLAIGFAMQDVIANFVAGVFIIQDEPFTVGDWIEWNGNEGVVREVQLRVTKLDTFDNELVTVPNSDLANAAVVNNVANDRRRVSVDFGAGYDDDVERAREAIVDEGARVDAVLDDPEPSAPVTQLGDSAVVLSGRVWIRPDESSYGAVRSEFVEAVKERFDADGLDMPYPNTELSGDITVTNAEARSATGGD